MIWAISVLIGFILYLLRDDFTDLINDIERLIQRSVISFILTVIALFIFFPISIPFTIYYLYKQNYDANRNNGTGFR